MGVLRLSGFSGMWPVRNARALPDNAALEAVNIRVDGGAYLTGASSPVSVKSLLSTTRSVFRIPLSGANTLVNSYWMEFDDIDTDVLRAPIVNDSFERIYWCSPSEGLRYAPKALIVTGSDGFTVGVLPPATMFTLDAVAGTGEIDPVTGENVAPNVTRSYVQTWVSQYGEESQPGPAVEETGATDQDWLITLLPQPAVTGGRAPITKTRIYRTVTSATGDTVFYRVVELNIGVTFYTDRLSDLTVSAQGFLESTNWAPPPEGMLGIVSMPNGVFVGWKDNNLFFSENYRPHAWPAEYTLTVDFPIVGLAVFGNTCVVGTTGTPYAVSGVKSAAMTLSKIDAPMPCLSRRSIISSAEGVYFSSTDGLVFVGAGGSSVVTRDLISREQWRDEYKPETHKAMSVAGVYVAARVLSGDVSEGFSFMPQNASERGVSHFDLLTGILNVGVEPWTGKPWFIGSNFTLYEWEVPGADPLSYRWKSREFAYPKPTNFSVYQAYFDDEEGDGLHLKVWAILRGGGIVSRVLVYDADVEASGQEIKLPSGFKSDIWQLELSGNAELQSFLMATSVLELKSAT